MRVFVEFDNRRVYWQVDVRHEGGLLQNLAHWFGPAEEESLAPSEMIPIREALAEIREILDRDDFGDSWEHDDWVFRDAAEKKLSEIEDALDGVPEPTGLPVEGAVDAVVTEEMIAETILKALVFTNENSKAWADGLARDIAALFRGGAK